MVSHRVHPRKLLVEGETDKRVIPYLMEANGVDWDRGNEPVWIASYGSTEELLRSEVIEGEWGASGLEVLGIMVDANGNAPRRWQQFQTCCREQFPKLPCQIPEEGFALTHDSGRRLGMWIMPDNRFSGMLEDFLVRLIPSKSGNLYEFAKNCTAEAAKKGAPFKTPHKTKAEIHTWLAWQDAPGKQLHQALHHRVLSPTNSESKAFVSWFRQLFGV